MDEHLQRHRLARFGLFAVTFAAFASAAIPVSAAPTPEEVCASSTPMNCGGAVLNAVKALGDDPRRALELGLLWGKTFEAEIGRLRQAGKLKTAEKDATKIEGWFTDEVDPIAKSADAIVEALLEKYLPKMATVLGLLEAPLAGVSAFFDSSEIASDFDELRLLNDLIQERIATKISPHLPANWRAEFEELGKRAGPELKAGP